MLLQESDKIQNFYGGGNLTPSSSSATSKSKNECTLLKNMEKEHKPTSFIDVTLAPEEASVFRKEYEHILSQLEHDLVFCTHPSDMGGISKKIAKLKEEIKVFNHYN